MRFLIPLALAAALPAGAQQMYRCGSAFSDHPCGAGQQVIGAPAPAAVPSRPVVTAPEIPASPEVQAAAKAGCLDRLKKDVQFRDPDSVRVSRVVRMGLLPLGNEIQRVYVMRVNAKNAYGGYTGDKDYFCVTDRSDERVIVRVRPADYE